MIAALMLLAATPHFVFEDVQPWRYSEGRQERIPALRARLVNHGSEDWAEARFRVLVRCPEETRGYEVTLRNIVPGSQNVDATAYEWIGQLRPCDGETNVEFLSGTPMTEERRPSYLILGFSSTGENGLADTHLEGILDYRRFDDTRAVTRRVYWSEGGTKLGVFAGITLYCFRVEPGRAGLAGLLLDRHPQSTGPLSRFLRQYDVPAGKAAFAGVFELFEGANRQYGVTLSEGDDAFQELLTRQKQVFSREIVRVSGFKTRLQGSFTLAP